MWSRKHDKCVLCGTVKKKHYAKGLCRICYHRGYHKNSRYKNSDERREYVKRKMKERYHVLKSEIEEVLGTTCIICGYDKTLEKHEKTGKSHIMDIRYCRKNLDDFVLLCNRCHKSVHWVMKNMLFSWDQIYYIVNGEKNNESPF